MNASGAFAAHFARTAGSLSPRGRSRNSGGFFGFGDHAAADASCARSPNGSLAESAAVLTAASASSFAGLLPRPPAAAARRQAAWAHDVQTAEHVRVLHADPAGAVAAHGVADEPAALPAGDRPVVRVDIRHHVVRDVVLEIAGRHRTGVHRAVVHRLRVRQDDDHLARALGECPFDRLRHVDLLRPLLRADRVAVQRVDDRVAAGAVLVIARRQEDDGVPIDRIALQIAFERRAVNRDALDDRPDGRRRRHQARSSYLSRDGEGADRRGEQGGQSHAAC